MRIFIAGQKLFGAGVLKLCIDRGHEVVGVSSPALSTDLLRADRLRAAAEQSGIRWQPAGGLRADRLPDGTDLVISAHSHEFIGRPTRLKARLGAIGYHPSLLPIHRGRDAVRWTIRLRERITGGSIYWLGDAVDAGDIAAQEHVMVRPGDTDEELWRRELYPLGLYLFDRVLADLEAGRIVRAPQVEELSTWEPSIGRAPIFRPELPLLGSIDGYEVCRSLPTAQSRAR